jgi:hypothetical protein
LLRKLDGGVKGLEREREGLYDGGWKRVRVGREIREVE